MSERGGPQEMARKKASAYDVRSGMYKGKGTGTHGKKIPRDGALNIARPVNANGRIRKDVG